MKVYPKYGHRKELVPEATPFSQTFRSFLEKRMARIFCRENMLWLPVWLTFILGGYIGLHRFISLNIGRAVLQLVLFLVIMLYMFFLDISGLIYYLEIPLHLVFWAIGTAWAILWLIEWKNIFFSDDIYLHQFDLYGTLTLFLATILLYQWIYLNFETLPLLPLIIDWIQVQGTWLNEIIFPSAELPVEPAGGFQPSLIVFF